MSKETETVGTKLLDRFGKLLDAYHDALIIRSGGRPGPRPGDNLIPTPDLSPHEAKVQFEVNQRIEALRGRWDEFLARCDLDGDGLVDDEELARARQELTAEVERELAELGVEPPDTDR